MRNNNVQKHEDEPRMVVLPPILLKNENLPTTRQEGMWVSIGRSSQGKVFLMPNNRIKLSDDEPGD